MRLKSLIDSISQRNSIRNKLREKLALPKPRAIKAFANEKEIFRKGTVLVTDTRLAYIDPFDRMLKTYMFEHMISIDKRYYRGSAINRRFCKALLVVGLVVLLITFIIDLLDTTSRGFVLVYLPALLSMFIGVMVWRDMKPKFKIQWRMRDGSIDQIATEPFFREWMVDSQRRETFMDELAQAMNEALSARAWWPASRTERPPLVEDVRDTAVASVVNEKPALTLVTDKYQ